MRKSFKLTHPKIAPQRLVESVISEVRKYIKRERKKKFPEGVDFWDFACKCGKNAEQSKKVHVEDLGKRIAAVAEEGFEAVYVEIVAKPGRRTKKPKPVSKDEDR